MVGRWIVVTLGAVAVMLVCRWMNLDFAAGAAKLTASTSFILVAFSAGALRSLYGKLIVAGLVFSWWGDAFLLGDTSGWFQAGLFSFLAAHLLYCVAFLSHGVRPSWTVGGVVGVGLFTTAVLSWLLPFVPGDMLVPVIAYVSVISVMAALSIGTFGKEGPAGIMIGALMFYVSDIAVAREAFVVPGGYAYLWGLPLYYGGQLCLAYTTALVHERTPASHPQESAT